MANQKQITRMVKCHWCETPRQVRHEPCPKCKKVPGEQLNDPPFGNKIVRKGKDSEGRLTAWDSEDNIYCWCPDEGGYYVWGLTIPQKVKMDGMEDLEDWEKEEYVRWRAEKANTTRWAKQRMEDSTRTGIKNRS